MPPTTRLALPLLVTGALLLAGCSAGDDPAAGGAAGSSAPVSSAAPAKTAGSPATVGTGGGATGGGSAGAGAGCPGPGAGVPQGADAAPTLDVDGDGHPDTLWMEPADPQGRVLLGVTTASGGTFTTGIESASPGARSALVADVTGRGELVALVGDGRQVLLYALSDCQFVPEQNAQGAQYAFDLGFTGHGTGVGCADVDGDGVRDLVGLLADGTTVTSTAVELAGPRATNGRSTTAPGATPEQLDLAHQVTCGDLTLTADGVTSGP